MARPILVTGSHRSGTTWVGHMLCLSGELGYIHEPFKCYEPGMGPGWHTRRIRHWFPYVFQENESRFRLIAEDALAFRYRPLAQLAKLERPRHLGRIGREWVENVRHRLHRRTPLLKDPIAVFVAPWLASRYDVRPVVLIRHPAAFAGSLKRLGWSFDFRHWRDQPALMRDLLGPFAAEIRRACHEPPDLIGQAILLWRVIYGVVHRYRQEHPSWLFVKHEALADAPVDGFRTLYRRLDLRWDDEVERGVRAFTARNNVKDVPDHRPGTVMRDSRAAARTWARRLTAEEVERVREGTADVAGWFYDDAEWRVAPVASDAAAGSGDDRTGREVGGP